MNHIDSVKQRYRSVLLNSRIGLVVILLMFILKYMSIIYLREENVDVFLGISASFWKVSILIPVVSLGLLVKFYWRCPNCGKSPGLTLGSNNHCQSCDIVLR